jgi:hypothetical protein
MVARHAGNDAGQYRSIVTITSANAEIVGVNRGDYCMTKAALSMMSKLFATRLAPQGIHVFELRPGIIRTDMIEPATATYDRLIENDGVPLQRWGEPEDIGGDDRAGPPAFCNRRNPECGQRIAPAPGVTVLPKNRAVPLPTPNCLPKSPVAMLLDFDGVIVDSVQLKIKSFLTVYAPPTPTQPGSLD